MGLALLRPSSPALIKRTRACDYADKVTSRELLLVTVAASGGAWFPQAPAQAPAPFDMLAQDLKVRHALEMAGQLAARAFRPPTAVPAPQSLAGTPGDLRGI